MDSEDPLYIYVLLQQKGRHYIGKTKDIEKRYIDHSNGKGAIWTSIFKPISVSEHFISKEMFVEENKTKEYMLRYGIYKVRGGPYSAPVLEDEVVRTIWLQLWHSQDLCFRCGGKHFIGECQLSEMPSYCCICGRNTHWASGCTEMNDIDGEQIPLGLVRR